jgi:hypothetical protein
MSPSHPRQRGSILVTILALMTIFTVTILGLMTVTEADVYRSHGRILLLQAQYSAESGADAAIALLNGGNTSYAGTSSDVAVLTTAQYKATYSTTVTTGSSDKERIIVATGKVYSPVSATTPTYVRKIRVTAQRSSTETASSVVSRNIIEIASGVKNLIGRDIYVNGFIDMAKNTTNLVAENITVAGKNTGASNCSIGGSGNLVKPASFSNAGQTKTNITVAYNNCINPPGNASNANFTVSANQTNISTIQSMYVPYSQYMDSTYGNAGSCADWTSGGTTRQIPSTLGSKKTHYPDNGSNVATTCGTSGDLSLGSNQYNITDNVHIRANLCAASACNPIFYNPSSSVHYVFVEGTVNFASVQTASGSGPIAFIVYGSDPASKTGSCPYGGAFYLGSGGNTSAPALYALATNGVCLDKTKFGSSPALGGLGGKNIYVATNPGTPFDLKLDPNFPVNQIPIDLSWRAVGYERL